MNYGFLVKSFYWHLNQRISIFCWKDSMEQYSNILQRRNPIETQGKKWSKRMAAATNEELLDINHAKPACQQPLPECESMQNKGEIVVAESIKMIQATYYISKRSTTPIDLIISVFLLLTQWLILSRTCPRRWLWHPWTWSLLIVFPRSSSRGESKSETQVNLRDSSRRWCRTSTFWTLLTI